MLSHRSSGFPLETVRLMQLPNVVADPSRIPQRVERMVTRRTGHLEKGETATQIPDIVDIKKQLCDTAGRAY